MLNGLDLFSGIGGITLALDEWVKPMVYCEIDRYCQSVLLSRMQKDLLPSAPIWDDIRTLDVSMLCGDVDIITGGFPCQDISVAGTGKGLGGIRSGLFFEILRLVNELRPSFVFLENVPAINVRGLDRVLMELTALGYDSRWTVVSAAEIGAPHIRKRWFLLAYADGKRLRQERGKKNNWYSQRSRPLVFDSKGSARESPWASKGKIKPSVDRTGDGFLFTVDRNRALGNAVVPAQAREAFVRLMGFTTGENVK